MDRPPVPAHYLRPNDKVWTPAACLFIDTETRTIAEADRDIETLRLWAGHYLDRRSPAKAQPRDVWAEGDTPAELAAWVDQVTRNRDAVWMFAHNLSFDLTTTRLPLELVKAGWSINDAAVGGKSPWMRLGRGKRVLTMVDSWSYLPRELAELARLVGMRKPKLPRDGDQRALWSARCRADVLAMERAMCQLMDWWDAERLGRFNISGPASGWNAFRHKLTLVGSPEDQPAKGPDGRRKPRRAAEPIVVDPEPTATNDERRAFHGGRRGTWTIGEHRAGPFAELDFTAAYPTVAAELPLPRGRAYRFDSMAVDSSLVDSERWGIIARVLVETDVPRWPVRIGRATWYPVGRFWCDLAGPDIAEARRLGCLVEIGAGWVHRLGMSMAPWARWVLDVQSGRDESAPAVARIAAKSWGRTVIGKWGSRGFDRVKLGPAPTSSWGYEEGWHHTLDAHCGMVDLAGQRWLVTAAGESDNSYPAIPAWVEAHVRVRLGRVVEALGPGAVLQCDTDGLTVAERVVGTVAARGTLVAPPEVHARARLAWCLAQLPDLVAPLSLRVKQRHSHVAILGPQHVTRGGQRSFTGIPGDAVETAPGEFTAKLWPKLKWQMGNGDPRGYVRPMVRPVIKGPWPTGWLLEDGRVVPVEVETDQLGRVLLRDWSQSRYWRDGLVAAQAQHPKLADLI